MLRVGAPLVAPAVALHLEPLGFEIPASMAGSFDCDCGALSVTHSVTSVTAMMSSHTDAEAIV